MRNQLEKLRTTDMQNPATITYTVTTGFISTKTTSIKDKVLDESGFCLKHLQKMLVFLF